MALQFLRVQNLMYFRSNHVHPTENIESKLPIRAAPAGESFECSESNDASPPPSRKCAICPVCILPVVVAFIFIFTIIQLIIIYHTIENYKVREQAYQDCYYPHGHHNGPLERHEEYAQQLDLDHGHNHDPGSTHGHGYGHRAMKSLETVAVAAPAAPVSNQSHNGLGSPAEAETQNMMSASIINKDNGSVPVSISV